MTLGYGSTNTIIENCIGTWDKLANAAEGEPYAIFGIDNAHDNKGTMRLLGCIAFKFDVQGGNPGFAFSTANFTADVIYKDLVALCEPDALDDDYIFYFGGSSNGSNITKIQGNNILCA